MGDPLLTAVAADRRHGRKVRRPSEEVPTFARLPALPSSGWTPEMWTRRWRTDFDPLSQMTQTNYSASTVRLWALIFAKPLTTGPTNLIGSSTTSGWRLAGRR